MGLASKALNSATALLPLTGPHGPHVRNMFSLQRCKGWKVRKVDGWSGCGLLAKLWKKLACLVALWTTYWPSNTCVTQRPNTEVKHWMVELIIVNLVQWWVSGYSVSQLKAVQACGVLMPDRTCSNKCSNKCSFKQYVECSMYYVQTLCWTHLNTTLNIADTGYPAMSEMWEFKKFQPKPWWCLVLTQSIRPPELLCSPLGLNDDYENYENPHGFSWIGRFPEAMYKWKNGFNHGM